jgi:hypothetical protein
VRHTEDMVLASLIVSLALAHVAPSSSDDVPLVRATDEQDASSWQRGVLAVLAPADDGAPIYANGLAECAVRLCCASGFVAGRAIGDCGLLSPEGKAIAFVIAIGSGVTGLALGAALAFAVYGVAGAPAARRSSTMNDKELEVLVSIVFAMGALFTLVGTIVGIGAALFIDHACIIPGKALFGSLNGTRKRRYFLEAQTNDAAHVQRGDELPAAVPKTPGVVF